MSKLALVLGVPAALGLVVWNVSLSSEIGELRERLAEQGAAKPDAPKAAPDARPRETSSRAMQQVNELAERLTAVESRLPAATADAAPSAAAATPAAPAPAGADVSADVAAAFSSEAFKSAVDRVLETREEARRKERMERAADARTRFLLRDLSVTDAQRADARRLVHQSLARIEEIRQDATLGEEQRRLDLQAAQAQQVESLAAVLDAASMEAVRRRTTTPTRRMRGADGASGTDESPAGGFEGGRRRDRGQGVGAGGDGAR